MSLQRKSPFRMFKYIVEATLHDTCIALGVLHVARLQIFEVGSYAMIVGGGCVFLEDALQFVAFGYNGLAFGRACHPIDALGYRMGAVGLHYQFVTMVVH